jgi:hypothetical protein
MNTHGTNAYNRIECGAELDTIPGLCRGFGSAGTDSFELALQGIRTAASFLFQSTRFAPQRIEERSPLQRFHDLAKLESL